MSVIQTMAGVAGLVVDRLTTAGVTVAMLGVAGLEVARLTMAGVTIAGLGVVRLTMAGVTVAGIGVTRVTKAMSTLNIMDWSAVAGLALGGLDMLMVLGWVAGGSVQPC